MPRITVALAALALAAALAGCTASPSAQDQREQFMYDRENDKAQADYYRSVERQREQETRRIVREELERQQPKGLRP